MKFSPSLSALGRVLVESKRNLRSPPPPQARRDTRWPAHLPPSLRRPGAGRRHPRASAPVRQRGTCLRGAPGRMCPQKVLTRRHSWMCLDCSTMQEDPETLLALQRANIVAQHHQAHQAGSPQDQSLCKVTDHQGFLHYSALDLQVNSQVFGMM
ncbi:uncharacterized protein LOC119871768 isoform X11 [Canis lupus familiaris]|uniref:uncharacterized protein LOC119871768 isoform X11 n=1 Tax=Canis lupus familiaris TaxID=9615 RepID=UPI0018F45F2B|nr:uncharacterized protein LOC119871768 isoform X11 [Canis lupus familiaris]